MFLAVFLWAQSFHWREFDPVEIETAVIDIGHREDMTSRLQRDE